jgi:predicted glycoside hydrolase/deacetylase ChbG (UPF0249 family)
MTSTRYLIVNADDFGQSQGVNCGIIEAYEKGIVTSASLMVRWPAAVQAAVYAREHSELSLGLHLDLCEWIYRDGSWEPLYEVVNLEDRAAVAGEMTRQLELFARLVGGAPSHIDSHQHVHRTEPMRSMLGAICEQMGVPLRDCGPEIRYCGNFYGQSANGYPYPEGISVDGLVAMLKALPSGITEMGCHPGFADGLESMYSNERVQEVQVLCDPRVREVIDVEGIELCSFRSIDRLNSESHEDNWQKTSILTIL